MVSSAILIPARYGSKRFEGKPLAMLDGVPMIKRVYDKCIESGLDTYVLTDDMRIYEMFDYNRCWIEEESTVSYANGTERCAGPLKWNALNKYDQFINVQGDMPDVTQHMIEKTEWHLRHYPITTMWTEAETKVRVNTNQVKVITAGDKALWFGRGFTYGNHHLGIYGYKRNALDMYSGLPITREEYNEGLEQLRWLKAGWDIGILHTDFDGVEINTPDDIETWQKNRLH